MTRAGREEYPKTHKITGHTQLLIQTLHPPPNLHILPNSVIQISQTHLRPEQLRNIQHIRYQIDISPQFEEFSCQF